MHGLPRKQGLYDPQFEHEACGVGFVADGSGKASRRIVQLGLTLLDNLSHRGATGCDPCTGDGAGIMIQIPHAFLAKAVAAQGIQLPSPGAYAVGMLFLPSDPAARRTCELHMERAIADGGFRLLGWRDLPTDNAAIGDLARKSLPVMRQVFIGRGNASESAFDRQLYVIRREVENAVGSRDGSFYIASLSCRTIVFKGLVTPAQLPLFYTDLASEEVSSSLAVVHSRFSTNTFPSWSRAHPYRFLGHNGEINTLKGNIGRMKVREARMKSRLFGDDLQKLYPIIQEEQSDSACLDNALEQIRIQNTQSRDIACTRLDAMVSFTGNTNRLYAIFASPAHGTLGTLNPNNGTVSYTPTTDYTGADSFSFTVNAGGVLSTGLVSVTVLGTNNGPVLANPIGTQSGGYGTNFTFTFPTNTFVDVDTPALTYSASGLPSGIALTGGTRTFAGIPAASGNYPVKLVATDNSVPPLSATNAFTMAIAKAALTITAKSTNKPYGVPLSFAGNEFVAAGLKLSDVVSAASVSSAGAPAGAAAGAYAIAVTNAIGTGLTNYGIAYVAGSLTVAPSAPYSITSIAVSNGVAAIAWQSLSNRIYRLQYKDTLTATGWTEVPVDIVGAGPSTSTTNATGGATNRFYRIK